MSDLPHQYAVSVVGAPDTNLTTSAAGLSDIQVAPPAQFGGPGDQWSPEDLLMAAVANCFVLSFKAIARASKVDWLDINCTSEGTLERQEKKVCFTRVKTLATLKIPAGQNLAAAERALEKAEAACLITNSMTAEVELECEVIQDE